jgi:hypothetical protein
VVAQFSDHRPFLDGSLDAAELISGESGGWFIQSAVGMGGYAAATHVKPEAKIGGIPVCRSIIFEGSVCCKFCSLLLHAWWCYGRHGIGQSWTRRVWERSSSMAPCSSGG